MNISNTALEMSVLKYTIEKHEGLVRFFHDERKIPFKNTKRYKVTGENLQKGRVAVAPNGEILGKEYTRRGMLSFPMEWYEQDHWAYDEDNGNVFRVKMKDGTTVEKKLCAVVPVGTKREAVLAQILDKDITVHDADNIKLDVETHHTKDYTIPQVKWCREFDGKNILALLTVKRKMSFQDIKMIIENEGGSVDANGIIHKDN